MSPNLHNSLWIMQRDHANFMEIDFLWYIFCGSVEKKNNYWHCEFVIYLDSC